MNQTNFTDLTVIGHPNYYLQSENSNVNSKNEGDSVLRFDRKHTHQA